MYEKVIEVYTRPATMWSTRYSLYDQARQVSTIELVRGATLIVCLPRNPD